MKKSHFLWGAANIAVLGTALSAGAAPTYYPGRPGALKDVVNHTRATVLADTQDPKKGYVVPPTSGEARALSFKARSANLGFCQEMANLQGYARDLSALVSEKQKEMAAKAPELKALRDTWIKANEELSKVVVSNEALRQLDQVQARVQEVEARLNDLYERRNNCNDPDGKSCDLIDDEIRDLQSEKTKLTKTVLELRKQAGPDYTAYQRAKSRSDFAKAAYDDGLGYIKNIITAITKAHQEIFQMYSDFGRLEGGFADILYDTGWDAAVATLRNQNPGYEMVKIPTHAAKIYATFMGSNKKDSYLASLPMVLDYVVNGKPVDPATVTDDNLLPALPSQITANLRLSLVGACPLNRPELFDLKKTETGVPVFAITALYDIPVAFRTKVKFSYNLYQFYELIKESGSDSGFFSSSSWSKVTENRDSKDTFEANWEESDPDHALSDAEKRAVEKEVKEELISRVLKQMAVPVVDGSPQTIGAPPVPTSGALVVAEGLEKTCGMYSYYCVGGAWVLRGLNAIFGSSDVTETYKSTANKRAEEIWDRSTVRWKPAVTVLARQE